MINSIQELQIGSYVRYGLTGEVLTVTSLDDWKISAADHELLREGYVSCFNGIKITSELLRKMGFEEVCTNTIQNRPKLAYSEETYGFSMHVGDLHITSLEAPYIHLLQKLTMTALSIGGDV